MNSRTSLVRVRGLFLCLTVVAAFPSLAEARTQRALTVRTQLRPVGGQADKLWFAPGNCWVDDFSGEVQSGTLDQNASLKVYGSKDYRVDFAPGFIRFEIEGGVKEGVLARDTTHNVVSTALAAKQSLTFKGGARVEFGWDGGVMHGTLAKAGTLEFFGPDSAKKTRGERKEFPAGTEVDFDGGGRLVNALVPRKVESKELDGTYSGAGTVTPEGRPPFKIAFTLVASGESFEASGDARHYSLQMKGHFNSRTGVIADGLVTGWVDLSTEDVNEPNVPVLRWTVRGAIEGTINPTASAGTLTMKTFGSPPRPNYRAEYALTGKWIAARTGPVAPLPPLAGGAVNPDLGKPTTQSSGDSTATRIDPPTLPPPAGGAVKNVALRKTATQSSIYRGTGIDQGPHLGCDGILESRPQDPHLVVHTNLENQPWWQVDLAREFTLSELRLYNRAAQGQERARTVQVLLSTDGSKWTKAYSHDGKTFKVLIVDLSGQKARYVRLQLAEKNYLHFQECEVYGKE